MYKTRKDTNIKNNVNIIKMQKRKKHPKIWKKITIKQEQCKSGQQSYERSNKATG